MRGRHNEDHQDEWDGDLRNPDQNAKELKDLEEQINSSIKKIKGRENLR